VAVLCNVSSGSATQYAHAVSDIFLKDRVIKSPPREPVTLTSAELDAVPGLYRNRTTGAATIIVRDKEGLRLERGVRLVPASARRFAAAGQTWEFDGRGGARVTADALGTSDDFERMPPAKATPAQLQELVGSYRSDDAETTMVVAVDEGGLVVKRRPDTVITLTPTYADAFTSALGHVVFHRNAGGKVIDFGVIQDRVWDLRFIKIPADTKPPSR